MNDTRLFSIKRIKSGVLKDLSRGSVVLISDQAPSCT